MGGLFFEMGGLKLSMNYDQETSEISTPTKKGVGTRLNVWNGTKTYPVFLLADEEVSWLLLPSLVSLLSGDTLQPESTYSCILKVIG